MDNSLLSPRVSIIIPVYNGEKFIPRMIECLKGQDFEQFEVIFVNDGSKDQTKDVLEKQNGSDLPFIYKVFHQENAGVSAARNKGLENAQGKYVCFIDVDDIIASDYLTVLYNAAIETETRIAVAHITRCVGDLDAKEIMDAHCWTSFEFLRRFLYQGIKYSLCACIFARECFEEHNIKFPVGYRYSEDVYVMWQLFAYEVTIAEIERRLYFYYDNPHSAMNTGIDIRRLDAVKLMQKLESFMSVITPEFAVEFKRYVVARHHWSILWQAATRIASFDDFKEYCEHFKMREELKKMIRYPEIRVSLSSLVYVISPRMYYYLLRSVVSFIKLIKKESK